MLPILPALLLLLLQGPANIDRMAAEGRLPAALKSMHRGIAAPANRLSSAADNVVLASLIAVSSDHEISQVLLNILSLVETGVENSPSEFGAEPRQSIAGPPQLGALTDGFLSCQRSRDGPF